MVLLDFFTHNTCKEHCSVLKFFGCMVTIHENKIINHHQDLSPLFIVKSVFMGFTRSDPTLPHQMQ